MGDHDISKMKVADLKKELKNRGLSTMGNKNELVDRLQGALIDGGDPLEDTAISEDLLEDDELNDDILEEEDDKHGDGTVEEDQMLKSPTPSEASKSESPEQLKELPPSKSAEKRPDKKEDAASAAAAAAAPQKKVALKRNISITIPTPPAAAAPVTAAPAAGDVATRKESTENASNGESKSDDAEPEKKIIKLNQLSAQERLELRAKKFGATTSTPVLSSDSKLQARAARFGAAVGDATAATGTPNLDALKKRAERFGVSVSDKMTKLEQQEKLQKRQERFGGGGTAATTTTAEATTESKLTATGKVAITAASSAGSVKTDYAERARQRLERFKNAA